MTQPFKYKDAAGNIVTADFDTTYGLRPELDSEETEWPVVATDPEAEETTVFVGRKLKK